MHLLSVKKVLACANVFEPIRPTILSLQPRLARIELAGLTSLAFRGIGAIVKWDVVVAYVFEPAVYR